MSATMLSLLHGCSESDFAQQALLWLGHLHSFTINFNKYFVLSNGFYSDIYVYVLHIYNHHVCVCAEKSKEW